MNPVRNASRHDLVWLRPDAASWLAWGAERQVVNDWISRKLPFVTARRHADYPQALNLGFTLSGVERRHRVSVVAKAEDVQYRSPPPSLREVMPVLPDAWRSGLSALDVALRQAGLEARVFGSAVTFFFTQEACLRPDSDVDLLLECRHEQDVTTALALLQQFDGVPRLDGELRFANGWAVSWRELAKLWDDDHAQVLVKSDDAVALQSVATLRGIQ